MAVVSVVQNADVGLAVQEAVGLVGGIESFVQPHDKVIIKPNLVTALPSDTGVTTDPRVVQAIVELCRRVNPSDVTVAEGSGGANTRMAFERCGYLELAQRYDVNLVDLNESQTTTVDVPDGKALRMLDVPNIILESDVLINVPKLKLYAEPWASLSVKNLLGALPGKAELSPISSPEFGLLSREYWTPEGRWFSPRGEKKRVHADLAEGIADLNTVIHPSLTVIDGIIALYGKSFKEGGKPLQLDTILAGRDPLALDCIATKIGGLNPLDIPYLQRAAERGLGESNYNRIQVVGTPLNEVIRAWETALAKLQGNLK